MSDIKVKKGDGPLAPTSSRETTHIRVKVIHSKERKVIYLDASPIQDMGGGMYSMMLCSGESIKLEAMPRLNRKRLADLEAEAERQLMARSGAAWDLVLRVLVKHSLVLDEAVTAAVA